MLPIMRMAAYLAAIGLSMYTAGWLILKADKNRTTGALAVCQLLVIIWCIPQLFTELPTGRGMKYFAYAVSYVGICFIGPAWLEFVFLYTGRRMRRWMEVLLFGIGAVHYSVMLTNETHHLFYRVFEVEEVVYGPVLFVHMAFAYLCVLAGMMVLLVDFRKKKVAPLHIGMILLSAAVPLTVNLLYITGTVKSGFDLTPTAFAVSGIFMLLAVFRYDFLDVNTMAFGRIFEEIGEGVVVYNGRKKITYCNRAAREWFSVEKGQPLGRLDEVLAEYGRSADEAFVEPGRDVDEAFAEPARSVEEAQFTLPDGTRMEMKRYVYRDKQGRVVAGNLMFTDVGKYYELLRQGRELAVSNQKLAIEIERNRIAQEVHDTVGHTLTMIHSLIRLLKVQYGESEYLEQAQELASGGIRELRCSINDLRRDDSCRTVTQGVYQLVKTVKGLEIEVSIQGEDGEEYAYLSPVVYECLREAVTNCLRYAGAAHMDVIVKFMKDSLGLYIFDDGSGCEDIQEGNGIRGIRERVEKNGGQVRFLSAPGEGFQISARFPVDVGVKKREGI